MDAKQFIPAIKPWAAALSVGLLWTLAFANFNQAWAAWLVPGLLLVVSNAVRPRRVFALGYVAGMAHYLTSLSWVLNIPYPPGAIAGWLALSLYCALYPAFWTWLCWRLFPGEAGQGIASLDWRCRTRWLVLCALGWVALEWVRSWMVTGFPWNFLGTSQLDVPCLPMLAALTGVAGVSGVVVFVSLSAAASFYVPANWNAGGRVLAAPLIVLVLALGAGRVMEAEVLQHAQSPRQLRVALVQPSIPQTVIWDSARDANRTQERWEQLLSLTEQALDAKPDLIVWPEASVPSLLENPVLLQRWAQIGRRCEAGNVWRVLGADEAVENGPSRDYYNSCLLISPAGDLNGTYRKQHLVMFGEYVPLGNVFPFLKKLAPVGNFSRGAGPQIFDTGKARLSPLICFEDLVAPLVRRAARGDVEVLINLTNDGWFGEGSQQWQHARNAAFRAIETGCVLIRCTNNGLTCWVDARGRVHLMGATGSIHTAGVRVADIPLPATSRGSRTFYSRTGDWLGWLAALICTGALLRRWKWAPSKNGSAPAPASA